jgi:beta-lactamase superfamily II metal-dependent hydrolase
MIARFDEERIARRLVSAPNEWKIGRDIVARILFPPAGYKAGTADDEALVIQLLIDQHRVLLTSDSGASTENFLVEQVDDLQSEILIKGQHHSGISGSAEFLEEVQPQLIIASSIEFPDSELVKDDWAQSLSSRGIKLMRQDETGAVRLRFFKDHWEAKPYLRAENLRSTSR